jgi:hypothetical protein
MRYFESFSLMPMLFLVASSAWAGAPRVGEDKAADRREARPPDAKTNVAPADLAKRVSRTTATIAKLDHVIVARYESYLTRRVAMNSAGLDAKQAAQTHLAAIRYLMMMEMPERFEEISDKPGKAITLPGNRELPWSALARRYAQKKAATPPVQQNNKVKYASAKLLYLIVMTAGLESREKFTQEEIGIADDPQWPVFIDGWHNPIMFLRWAPGFTRYSDRQRGDSTKDHDPFDPRAIEPTAYKLIPFVYSAGLDQEYGIDVASDFRFRGDNLYQSTAGAPIAEPDGSKDAFRDNITNHQTRAEKVGAEKKVSGKAPVKTGGE